MTRNVVPQPHEPRGFLRRRRTDVPAPDQPAPPPVAPVAPVAPEPTSRTESDELLRAKDALLQAALRQCDELTTALLNEQHLRGQEHERLTAENAILRDTLASLNADALAKQQVPEQRGEPTPPVVPDQEADTAPGSRRRSVRRAGPG